MKSFRTVFAAVIAAITAVFITANLFFINADKDGSSRPYRVEAERIAHRLADNADAVLRLENYTYITGVERLTADNADDFYNADSDYLVKVINGDIYRMDYSYTADKHSGLIVLNVSLAAVAVLVTALLLFLQSRIIKPFEELKEVPFELAKGRLTHPLKEQKGRYLGRFLWGLDLLRERLEQQRANELELQKEKKTLVLSLSHDIKTPLGVIELYAKALEKGLYDGEEKKREIARSINAKCDEIKGYVDKIIKASHEDFLKLEVREGEFYLSQLIREINSFYTDKLELLKIDFTIGKYMDCLLKGDIDRAVEVLQNIVENAIKYGDGKYISISAAIEDSCLLVSVCNSGCTLNSNELAHIFDSFWRGSNVGSNSGSGLGLYICRQLMHKMDGDIFAEIRSGDIVVTVVFCMV